MKSLKSIYFDIKVAGQVKGLMDVYEQVAAVKMQTLRKEVEISQIYFKGLSKIAEEIALDLSNFNAGATKSAIIFLSADQMLYGDIIEKTMVKFVNFIKEDSGKSDIYVVGDVGQNLIKLYAPNVKYTKIDVQIDKDAASEGFLQLFLPKISDYKKVTLFYAEFKSLANQDATSIGISGEDVAKAGRVLDKDESLLVQLKYIYEPNVATVSEKFAKEITMSILDQSVKENQLAKFASRLMYLDTSINNIDKKLFNLGIERRKANKRYDQRKQSERVSRVITLNKFI